MLRSMIPRQSLKFVLVLFQGSGLPTMLSKMKRRRLPRSFFACPWVLDREVSDSMSLFWSRHVGRGLCQMVRQCRREVRVERMLHSTVQR